ncbi:heavy metal translocating P-type ATPase [Phreatobacter cathodiphilus]|uniref:P-type Zn(2+) transporter n=1 Tax=Phreatobacter cathodiphilus TaxID=1868589 RepID=A0A2S0NEZ9_9HYPH|nr:heavy metal translocating P-type ATPase [Phreatobacter cathodiphilus]AVO46483.1 heavy metal translocating P-type ATPase [Phreatobacter cathodiphilus]
MAADRIKALLPVVPAAGLAGGLLAGWLGHPAVSGALWSAATLVVLLALAVEIVTSLRRGEVGLDLVAFLSMTAALLVGETLAAAVVALMYAGGQNLEAFAERRARRDMAALLGRAPHTAMRYQAAGLAEVDLAQVAIGDRLLVRQGDVVAVDGTVTGGLAVLDEAAITGESVPVQRRDGEAVLSGTVNVGGPFDMTAGRVAKDSTLAGIVRMVEGAQRSKAPMARLADRFALAFLGLAVAMAGGAWLLSGDPVRAVAVLVVATPCPLILAVPVAIVSGLSRAAARGILIKGGKALEALARVRVLVFDKTGTLTRGEAEITSEIVFGGLSPRELLRLAASADQVSKHVVARTLVAAAEARGLGLAVPSEAREVPGEGVVATIDGREVAVGGVGFVTALTDGDDADPLRMLGKDRGIVVAVAVDGRLAGGLLMVDELRPGAADLLHRLRGLGIVRIVLATGDRRAVAEAVTADLPVDAIHADLAPGDKVAIVVAERAFGAVMMVGDGVNDAPALAAAEIGVAMGATGSAAAAETADVVLLVDQLDRLAEALAIAARSRSIALQSVVAGLGLSVAGMTAAAFGLITPVQGAVMQEVIDVAVILNALRALTPGRSGGAAPA